MAQITSSLYSIMPVEFFFAPTKMACFLTKMTIFYKKCKKICANWKFLLILWAIY